MQEGKSGQVVVSSADTVSIVMPRKLAEDLHELLGEQPRGHKTDDVFDALDEFLTL